MLSTFACDGGFAQCENDLLIRLNHSLYFNIGRTLEMFLFRNWAKVICDIEWIQRKSEGEVSR